MAIPLDEQVRYGCFTLRTECSHCGHPVVLDGPTQAAHCSACNNDVRLPSSLWKDLLGDFDDVYYSMKPGKTYTNPGLKERGFRVDQTRQPPACEKCGAAFPVDELRVGTSRKFACTDCADPASTAPTPGWLSKLVPNARQLFFVDAAPREAQGEVDLGLEREVKPVAMMCPQCGGGLQVGAGAERIFTCRYCQADIYLPDAVWRRLHPVRTVKRWFVRFEGLSLQQRERQRELAEAKKKRRAATERRARKEEQAREEREREQQVAARIAELAQTAARWRQALLGLLILGAVLGWGTVAHLLPAGQHFLPMAGTWAVATLTVAFLGRTAVVKILNLRFGPGKGSALETFVIMFWLSLGIPVGGPVIGVSLSFEQLAKIKRGRTTEPHEADKRPGYLLIAVLGCGWQPVLVGVIGAAVM